METTSERYLPLITSPYAENIDWTVRESEAGGSLTLKMPESVSDKSYYPYAFFANAFVVESGTIHSEMVLCFASTFEMNGGDITIDKNTGIYAAIQTIAGGVNLNGGKLTIRNAVCGVAAREQKTYVITLDGTEVDIQASAVGLSGKAVLLKSGKAVVSAEPVPRTWRRMHPAIGEPGSLWARLMKRAPIRDGTTQANTPPISELKFPMSTWARAIGFRTMSSIGRTANAPKKQTTLRISLANE